ncbi:MAG TPA: hypothetical protein IAB64_06285 [Candidatus Coproplasma excrementavium]|nr:hypothetical protein [Candidatus Coproplasma excrementavium]
MNRIYGDRLHREEYVEKIVELIKLRSESKESTSFSIEAPWGQGKTWLIEKIEASLEGVDITKKYESEECYKENNEYFIVHYNAWERDYYDEPLLAIILAIINAINNKFSVKNTLDAAKKEFLSELRQQILHSLLAVASHVSKQLLHFDIIELGKRGINKYKEIKEKSKLKPNTSNQYFDLEKDIQQVVNALNKFSEYKYVIFIVDELDRCIPTFAIKTLERLHHIFDRVDRSITILTINRSQIIRSINHTYGEGSADKYLSKFIDFRIDLNEGNTDNDAVNSYLQEFATRFQDGSIDDKDKDLIYRYNSLLTAREFEQVMKRAVLIHDLVGMDTKYFSMDCLVAELLLQIKQAVDEIEGNNINTSTENGNVPKTPIGQIFKNDLNYYRQTRSNVFRIINCIIKNRDIQNAQTNNSNDLTQEMQDFYSKYRLYYNLVKHA